MNRADKIYRKIKTLSKKIARLSAYEDFPKETNQWWGLDTNLGDLPLQIQRHLAEFTDWLLELEEEK